jgi:hypothetical protein
VLQVVFQTIGIVESDLQVAGHEVEHQVAVQPGDPARVFQLVLQRLDALDQLVVQRASCRRWVRSAQPDWMY